MSLRWKASWGGNEYRIFRGKLIAGIVKTDSWRGDAHGELNGHMVLFRKKSIWTSDTILYDIEGKQELGAIDFEALRSRATVTLYGQDYAWKYNTFWGNEWELGGNGQMISYTAEGWLKQEGEIEEDYASPLLILAGLYVEARFRKRRARR